MREQDALSSLVRVRHLAGRFFGSLFARAPSAAERAVVAARLTAGEADLFAAMSRADQREGLRTASAAQRLLPAGARTDEWWAAALLHDCGKQVAGLGVVGRSVAALVPGSQVEAWATVSGWRRRIADHRRHDVVGAALLAQAGARDPVVQWARNHHDRGAWGGYPDGVAVALARADGERV